MFSLVNTWAFADKFTSAQANAIAVDLTLALDKSTAGDTLSGVITMANTAAILASYDANITADGVGAISSNAANSITANVAAGISTTVAGGIAPSSGGSITDGGIVGGIVGTIAGGIQSGVAGGFRLTGGGADWITYASPRSINVAETCGAMVMSTLPSNWSTAGPDVVNSAVSTNVLYLSPHKLINGSTSLARLASITICMAVGSSHSGVPATAPTVSLYRRSFATGGIAGNISMFSTGAQSFWPPTGLGGMATPASGTAWTDSGNVQRIAFTVDTAFVIDNTAYGYYLAITDEQGANALGGNEYFAVIFSFTSIVNTAL